ncbi:hypothetical protein TIFTF001_027374 [Ficus carica]|uniref:Uncharacterized protein n=1 Tax=Ficus carica TaxID=3494 RepID=A0AA88IYC8_FICCA|nr:hypothetical protein TIFTF001_027374 [Ficus carica]
MMISRMLYVVLTRTRSGLVHGLSWTGLAAPTTPWLRATVSKLMAVLDTRQWSVSAAPTLHSIASSTAVRLLTYSMNVSNELIAHSNPEHVMSYVHVPWYIAMEWLEAASPNQIKP